MNDSESKRFASETATTVNDISDAAERIGYLRAYVEMLDEFQRIGMKEAAVAIALFGKSKGLGK